MSSGNKTLMIDFLYIDKLIIGLLNHFKSLIYYIISILSIFIMV